VCCIRVDESLSGYFLINTWSYSYCCVHVVDPLKESDKWVEDPPISVEEAVGIEESPLPGYSSYHDYDPLGIAIDEARVGRNKLPVEQVESLYPDGMNFCQIVCKLAILPIIILAGLGMYTNFTYP